MLQKLSKLSVAAAMLAFAFVWPAAKPAHASCFYCYIDTIYTDATKSEECGWYSSCDRSHDGCQTPYRTTETTYYCQ
jgi:predicted transglutaminase-like cysteine proteinase